MKIAASEALWDTEQPAGVLALPDRRLHRGRPDAVVRHRDPRPALVPCHELVRRPGGRDQRAPEPVRAAVRPGQLHPGRAARLLEHARDGVPRHAPRSSLALWGAWLLRRTKLDDATWFQRAALVAIAFPFLSNFAGLDPDRGRAAAVGRLRASSRPRTRSRRTVSAWTVGLSLGMFVSLYPVLGSSTSASCAATPGSTRPRPAADETRRRRPSRRRRTEMTLEILWFCLLAFFWTGYFVLEGFDFGVGMLLPVLGRSEERPRDDARVDRPGLGRQRGVARHRGRRDVRGLPGLVRDDVLRLLPRPAAHPRVPHRSRAVVRVAREGGVTRLEGGLGVAEHDRVVRRSVPLGHRAFEPAPRRPDRLGPDVRRRLRRPVQRLHGPRRSRCLPPLRPPRRGLPHAAHAR